jgi:hypothetical protein
MTDPTAAATVATSSQAPAHFPAIALGDATVRCVAIRRHGNRRRLVRRARSRHPVNALVGDRYLFHRHVAAR